MGRKEMKVPKIHVWNEWDTIHFLKRHKRGIARFGDGEFKLCLNRDIKSQLADKELGKRLRHIASFPPSNPCCVVGIPNIYGGILAEPGTKGHSFWTNMYNRGSTHAFVSPDRVYFSSFITRPDNTSGINNMTYYHDMMKLWEGRKVVVVRGKDIAFCKHPALLENADIIGEVVGPNCNAWAEYPRILKECMAYPKDTLYLIRLGPTATVLAWDLGMRDRQGLDLGHLGMMFNRFMTKDPEASEPEFLNYGRPMGT